MIEASHRPLEERDIQLGLYHHQWAKVCIPNTHLLIGEQDMLAITRSRYAYEYEIKLSLSDFRVDFKKRRCWGETKHNLLASAHAGRYVDERIRLPRRFWFVCPEGVIPEEDVPDHAGLMYVTRNRPAPYLEFTKIKAAPLIRAARKLDADELLNISYNFSQKYWGMWTAVSRNVERGVERALAKMKGE